VDACSVEQAFPADPAPAELRTHLSRTTIVQHALHRAAGTESDAVGTSQLHSATKRVNASAT
jgi:hypothetical protein